MEKNQKITIAMKYGAVTGGIIGLLYVIAFFIKGDINLPVIGLIQLVLIGFMLYKGVVHYRNHVLEGFISYKKSLYYCIRLGLYAAIVIGFVKYLMYQIEPQLLENMIKNVEKSYILMNPNITDEELDVMMNAYKKISTPFIIGFVNELFSVVLWSVIMGVVVSFFTKKDNDTFSSQFKEEA